METKFYIIWLWRMMILASMLASCYYSHKGDEHKEIICMLQTIIAATVPLAIYVLD